MDYEPTFPVRANRPMFKHDIVPAKVEKMARTAKRKATDEEENAKVKARAKGRCEIVWFGRKSKKVHRCKHAGNQTHHMIGGRGKRAVGISILAEHKQYACQECHSLITGRVLKRVGGDVPMFTDEYERVDR